MKDLKKLAEEARKSVENIADNDIRGRAFEVALAYLLRESDIGLGNQSPSVKSRKEAPPKSPVPESTLPGRILSLKGEGIFKAQRGLGEVREELRKRGWHYPVTSLSGPLQLLVRQRQLRREQVKDGKKRIWKYSNY
jgi:hypothetical protein